MLWWSFKENTLWNKKGLRLSYFRRKSVCETFWSILLLASEANTERDIAEALKKHLAKGVSTRKHILCSILLVGKELSEVENKADQMLGRVILSKISTTWKGNTDFSKLIELEEKYKKDDLFLTNKLNNRGLITRTSIQNYQRFSWYQREIRSGRWSLPELELCAFWWKWKRVSNMINTFCVSPINKKANNIGNTQSWRRKKRKRWVFSEILGESIKWKKWKHLF